MGTVLCRIGEQTTEFGMETSDIFDQKCSKLHHQKGSDDDRFWDSQGQILENY
jgi:hypothetical protein